MKGRLKGKLPSVLMPVLAILSAFLVGSVLLVLAGYDVLDAGRAILEGTFGSQRAVAQTLVKSAPLMLIGVGVAIAFKGSSFNIGAEGQFFAGALGATLLEGALRDLNLPSPVLIALLLLASVLFGGICGAIPGYLKAKRGASEVVTSVMISSIMILLVGFLVNGPIQEPTGIYSESREIVQAARLPYIWGKTKLHAGILIAVVVALLAYVVLEKTTYGFKIKMAGQSALCAEYAGVNPKFICVSTLAISGAIAGLAGGIEVLGLSWKLYVGISPGYGYNAIAVALLAGLNPLAIIFSAVLFGALNTGCNQMARVIGVPASLSSLLQALVLLFVVAYAALRPQFTKLFQRGGSANAGAHQ